MRSLVLIAALPLAACNAAADSRSTNGVAPTGTGTSRTYAVADFIGVSLRGSDDVDVRVGTGFSVRAEGPTTALDKLEITKVGETLRISRKKGFSWGDGEDVKVFVTMPRIVSAETAGSGDLSIDRVEGQRFSGSTAGSGSIAVGALAVELAEFDIAGSGDVQLSGTAREVKFSVAGSGDIDGGALTAEKANVSVAGSGSVKAAVTGPASVAVMGSGDVDLGAGARCTTSKMGSGEVRCGG